MHWCDAHSPCRAGSDDVLATARGTAYGSAEAGGDDNRRWCELIHRDGRLRASDSRARGDPACPRMGASPSRNRIARSSTIATTENRVLPQKRASKAPPVERSHFTVPPPSGPMPGSLSVSRQTRLFPRFPASVLVMVLSGASGSSTYGPEKLSPVGSVVDELAGLAEEARFVVIVAACGVCCGRASWPRMGPLAQPARRDECGDDESGAAACDHGCPVSLPHSLGARARSGRGCLRWRRRRSRHPRRWRAREAPRTG